MAAIIVDGFPFTVVVVGNGDGAGEPDDGGTEPSGESDDNDFRLYGPLLMPFLRSLRTESRQLSSMPYLTHRVQGRSMSHFLQAFWQFTVFSNQ
jgi:hypothetical protein